MKKQYYLIYIIALFCIFSVSGCKGKKPEIKQEAVSVPNKPAVAISNETTLILKDLKDNGDYVNSKSYPKVF